MNSQSYSYSEDDINQIRESLAFSQQKKEQIAQTLPAFKGIQHTSGSGTTTSSVTDLDWKEEDLKLNTSSKTFPPALEDPELELLQLSGPILFIAATHSIHLPITYAQLTDVILVHFCNLVGYSPGEYVAGKKMLTAKYKTPHVTNFTEYTWPGYREFRSKIRADFMAKLKSRNYTCFDDLFAIYSTSNIADVVNDADKPGPSSMPDVRPSVRDAQDSSFLHESQIRKIGDTERTLIERIQDMYAAGQLPTIGVALSYLLVRLVAKSTDHVINKGKEFGVSPNKYGLNMNPALTFEFNPKAIETIRTNMTAYSSTVATYLQSLVEFINTNQDGSLTPNNCKIQIKAMIEIRLAFYGMVIPALGLSVADKLRISGEHLAYISYSNLTQDGCNVFLDFLSRLSSQNEQYRIDRGLASAGVIDPNGPFRFCRLFNQQYMMKLSGIKHIHTSYLWMYIQRNLEQPTSATTVRDSDKVFARLTPLHMEFLAELGNMIIGYYSGASTAY
ncbi:unnamed protein product [Haemonchus placei]|uniref:Nucleocapsid protein n=1 Tax=Haemonchus placei TaxID=6290 RepID=A0A0N4VVU7_HAEPC|nr:unnamed protein product [Haemonchus placei]